MNTTETKHKELIPYINRKFKEERDLKPFFDALDKDVPAGVNDFTVPFHRNAFDYCDSQFIIIRHKGEENLVNWSWNQYSGYEARLLSDSWFEKVLTENFLQGTCEQFKYNHWEHDYNKGRFISRTQSSAVPVKGDGKYGLLVLNHYGKTSYLTEGICLDSINGPWYRKSQAGKLFIKVTRNGESMLLSEDGLLMPENRDMIKELKEAKETFTDKERILNEWIRRNKPCASRYGFAYRGANAKRISPEEAERLLPKYSFGEGFYELKFELLAEPTLVFNEYSENDMW